MAWTHLDNWRLFEDVPYMQIAPYTGYYQIRRKYEDSSTGSSYGFTSGYQTIYYAWGIIRNRLRAVYPSGGRMGMCIVFEKIRTGRYCPYNSYTWPNFNDNMPLWSIPTTLSKRYTNYTRIITSGLGDFHSTGLTYGWTVGYGEVEMANDTHPPAGFCTDLRGCLVYVVNTAEPAQTIELESPQPELTITSAFKDMTSQSVVIANRYGVAPLSIQPELVPGVEGSATSSLSTYRPSGIFWPKEDEVSAASNTFDVTRILPEVETWREANIFPVGYADEGYIAYYIANFPRDYTLVYNYAPEAGSILYGSNPDSADSPVHNFEGFVYWVTREGPVDFKEPEEQSADAENAPPPENDEEQQAAKGNPQVTRFVYNFIFEADGSFIQDNIRSKYRSTIDNLVGTTAIAPLCRTAEPKCLLQPYMLPLGGRYNSVFTDLHMTYPGAPASSDRVISEISEIAFHYDTSMSVMCGNVMIDRNIFDRVMTSGQIHSPLWSTVGRLYSFTTQQTFPGSSYTLMGLMATIGILGQNNTNYMIFIVTQSTDGRGRCSPGHTSD